MQKRQYDISKEPRTTCLHTTILSIQVDGYFALALGSRHQDVFILTRGEVQNIHKMVDQLWMWEFVSCFEAISSQAI